MADRLSELAKQKEQKPDGNWESMSVIGRKGKSEVVKVGYKGVKPQHVVHGEKNSGQGTSKTGFARGEVFSQNLDD